MKVILLAFTAVARCLLSAWQIRPSISIETYVRSCRTGVSTVMVRTARPARWICVWTSGTIPTKPVGANGVIEPGDPASSELMARITSDDESYRMPPPDSSKQPLTAGEKDIIKRWIEEGAEYADFWAFVPPRKPAVPEVENERWSQQPIDRFVLRRLEAEGLAPNPTADRRTLIRRLSFDLTGLPPTREEIRDFLADTSAGAYERLVDRLLAKPQYGEHMTKYWLDLVRFADTNGIHHDHYREMTPYRDWVIRAFNQNLPYDEFVKYQLAGDLYPEPTRDQLIASGFNRLHLIIDRGNGASGGELHAQRRRPGHGRGHRVHGPDGAVRRVSRSQV